MARFLNRCGASYWHNIFLIIILWRHNGHQPRQIKKTKTAPLAQLLDKLAPIAEPDSAPLLSSSNALKKNPFVKTITDTMTLDRKNKKKASPKMDLKGSLSPRSIARRMGTLKPIDPPVIQEPINNTDVKKKRSHFSKIAILSSFFERKAAAVAGKAQSSGRKKGIFDLPNFARLKVESKYVAMLFCLDWRVLSPWTGMLPGLCLFASNRWFQGGHRPLYTAFSFNLFCFFFLSWKIARWCYL